MSPYAYSERILLLLRTRTAVVSAGLWLVLVAGLCFAPLLGKAGFLHALALTVGLGLLGVVLGARAARREREIASPRPTTGVPLHLRRAPGGPAALLRPVVAAASLSAAALGVGLAAILVNGLRVGTCDLAANLLWYPVLPLPTALLAPVVGVLVGTATIRRWTGLALGVLAVLGSVVVSAWPILEGPQAFAFNHLLGWVPGPLYDERAIIGAPILSFRLLSLAWTGALLGLGGLLLQSDGFRFGPPAPGRQGAAGLLLISGLTIVGLQLARSELGFHQSAAAVAETLGGEHRTAHFVLHYPKERDEAWVARTARDHEFRLQQVAGWLGVDPEDLAPIHSWVFRSAEEKAELTGAGRTSIAKPWLSSIYLHDLGHPHPVLKHELAHVVSGAFGSGPFRVASPDGVRMNVGLVEGIAVASDWPADVLSVHGWARAMRAVGAAPDIRGLFSTTGFWAEGSSQAYTLAGSFVRWLADTRGMEAVRAAYAAGDVAAAGDPPALFAAWEAFLDGEPPSPAAIQLAETRFRRPGILRRPCAFDVAEMRAAGFAALGAGQHEEAAQWFGRCAELEPDDPWHLRSLLGAYVSARDTAAAAEVSERLLTHAKTDPALRTETHLALGDALWAAAGAGAPQATGGTAAAFPTGGATADLAQALAHYQQAAREAPDGGLERLAFVKERALAEPTLGAALRPFLLGEVPFYVGWMDLRELVETRPADPLPRYLLGRQLFNAAFYDRALPWLESAEALGLTREAGLALENLRLIARTLFELEDYEAAATAWRALADHPDAAEGDAVTAADWAERCDFAREAAGQAPDPAADGAPTAAPAWGIP